MCLIIENFVICIRCFAPKSSSAHSNPMLDLDLVGINTLSGDHVSANVL